MDASPRGPNQPRNDTVGRRAPVPIIAIPTGTIRISVRLSTAHRTACQVALSTAGTSSTAPKMTKVVAASNAPVSSMRYETLPPSPPKTAEEGSAHERCDEARAPDRLRETERERSPGEERPEARWCDRPSPDTGDHDSGSDCTRAAPASAP